MQCISFEILGIQVIEPFGSVVRSLFQMSEKKYILWRPSWYYRFSCKSHTQISLMIGINLPDQSKHQMHSKNRGHPNFQVLLVSFCSRWWLPYLEGVHWTYWTYWIRNYLGKQGTLRCESFKGINIVVVIQLRDEMVISHSGCSRWHYLSQDSQGSSTYNIITFFRPVQWSIQLRIMAGGIESNPCHQSQTWYHSVCQQVLRKNCYRV